MTQRWVLLAGIAVTIGRSAAVDVSQWGVHEIELTAGRDFASPLYDVELTVEVTGPDGTSRVSDGFWDGGRTWRARFSPDRLGTWTWRTTCAADAALDGATGTITCVPYDGDNPVFRHGPVQLGGDGYRLVTADGEPFFWLGDTAWNGALRSADDEWERYLSARREQAFNVVQLVTTQWRGCQREMPEPAYVEGERLAVNPGLFQRIDRKVAEVNAHGLYAAPVVLWALTEADPGTKLPVEQAIRLARYIVARLEAYQVIWLLGGDGRYLKDEATIERWHAIGRGVFDRPRTRLATLHPCGTLWLGEEFRDDDWFDFIGTQSSHGGGENTQKFIVDGKAAAQWDDGPPRPIINLEPCYETHPWFNEKSHRHEAYHVRRASYWSLLSVPAAGVTFGHNQVWPWSAGDEAPEGHEGYGKLGPWTEGIDTPGVRSMTLLHSIFASLPWAELKPAPERLAAQPGKADVFRWQAVAATADGRCVVAYLPVGGRIELREVDGLTGEWIDPRTGARQPADPAGLTAPDEQDWLLVLSR